MTTAHTFFLLGTFSMLVACGDKDDSVSDDVNNEISTDDTGEADADADADADSDADADADSDADADADADDTGMEDTGMEDTGGSIEGQEPPAPADFDVLSEAARDEITQTFTMDASEWSNFTAEQGSTLSFSPNSFTLRDGSLATGDIEIEFVEIFDKGTMLITDTPTIGRSSAGEVAQLISGGEHYVGANQDGVPLQMNSTFQLTAPADATGGPDTAMELFRAEDAGATMADIEDDVIWREAGGEGEFGIGRGDADTGGGASSYWMTLGDFGWSNIDRWYSDPRPKTTIHVDVPDGWDNDNCSVYLSYDGEPTALARFDTYDASTGLFSEHYGLIPIGLEVHIIFVTESEGEWSYAIEGTTIVDGHLTTFASSEDFVETDAQGLADVINALP